MAYSEANKKEKQREASRRYRAKHPERRRKSYNKWWNKNKERNLAKQKEYRKNNPDKLKRWRQNARLKLKKRVMDAYGGQCACCGEGQIEFLQIDHIDGGGTQARKKHGQGDEYYRHIVKCGFPPNKYQVLCANCNTAKGILGYCPHQSNNQF